MGEVILLGWIAIWLVLIRTELRLIRAAIALNSALHVEGENARTRAALDEFNNRRPV